MHGNWTSAHCGLRQPLLTSKVARKRDAVGGAAAALAGADIWSSVTGDVSTGSLSAAHAGKPPSSTATLQHKLPRDDDKRVRTCACACTTCPSQRRLRAPADSTTCASTSVAARLVWPNALKVHHTRGALKTPDLSYSTTCSAGTHVHRFKHCGYASRTDMPT